MNFQFSKKKLIIILILAIVFLIGWFVLRSNSEEEVSSIEEPVISQELVSGETFEIVRYDTEEKFLEQREKGLKVKIPEGWTVKKYNQEVDILSPEVKFDEDGKIYTDSIEEGACGVAIEILESKVTNSAKDTDINKLREKIELVKANPEEADAEDEAIEIDGVSSLKKTFRKEDGGIINILVEIPVSDSVFFIDSGIIMFDKCVSTFEDILETIEITK